MAEGAIPEGVKITHNTINIERKPENSGDYCRNFYQVPGLPRPDPRLVSQALLFYMNNGRDVILNHIMSYWNSPSDYDDDDDLLWEMNSVANKGGPMTRSLVRVGMDGPVQSRIPMNIASEPEAFSICATHAAWVCNGIVSLYNLRSGEKNFESPVPEGVVAVQLTKNRVLLLGKGMMVGTLQDAQQFSHTMPSKKGSFVVRPDGSCQFVEHPKRSWIGVLNPKTGALSFIKNLQNGFDVRSFCPMVDKGEGKESPNQNDFLVFGQASDTGNLMIARGNALSPNNIIYADLGRGTLLANHWNGFGFLGLIQEVDEKRSNDRRDSFANRVVYTSTMGSNFDVKQSAITEIIQRGNDWPQEQVFIYDDNGVVLFNGNTVRQHVVLYNTTHNAIVYDLPDLTQRSANSVNMFAPNTTRSYMVGPLHLKLRTFFDSQPGYLFNLSEPSGNLAHFSLPENLHSEKRIVYQNPQSRLFMMHIDRFSNSTKLYNLDFSNYLNARGIGTGQRRNVSLSYLGEAVEEEVKINQQSSNTLGVSINGGEADQHQREPQQALQNLLKDVEPVAEVEQKHRGEEAPVQASALPPALQPPVQVALPVALPVIVKNPQPAPQQPLQAFHILDVPNVVVANEVAVAGAQLQPGASVPNQSAPVIVKEVEKKKEKKKDEKKGNPSLSRSNSATSIGKRSAAPKKKSQTILGFGSSVNTGRVPDKQARTGVN